MGNNIYDTYLEAEVLGADPVKLVHMLYRGAIEAVSAARRQLIAGGIRERSRQIMRAWNILRELTQSLDHARGAEISRPLAGLYGYMQTRLMEANTQQSDAPLAEVESLLITLADAWQVSPRCASAGQTSYQPVSCTC